MAKRTIERKNMTQKIGDKVTREPAKETAEEGAFLWWEKFENEEDDKDDRLAYETISTIRFIQQHNSARMDQLIFSTRLYGKTPSYNAIGSSFSRSANATANPSATRISFNLCASVIDALTAQIAKNKVVPTFITSGGIWGTQRKAEKLSKFTEGLFYENKAHEKITYQAQDSGIWGDGYLEPYRTLEDRVGIRRVVPHEIVYDILESMTGNMRQMHRVYPYDRGLLLAEFPDMEDVIRACPKITSRDIGGQNTAADLVLVGDSIHLRSGPKGTDGCRIRTLLDSAKTIHKREWKYDYFPWQDLMYARRPVGGGGQGACERLQDLQGEINRNMITIQRAHWLGSGFKILSHITDKVPAQHFNNEIGPIIKWSGDVAPQYIAPPTIQSDLYSYVDSLIAKGYQQEGVSQLAASNLAPQGIKSGAGLRIYDSIAEDRQMFFAQRVEGSALDLTKMSIDVAKEIYKEKGKYEVVYPNTNFTETIDWSEIDLDMDEFWLKAFPTSELPEEPAAKLETVQEYMQAGLISPRAGRRLLAMPDVEMSDKLANAAEELICKSIEDILYDGKKDIRPDAEWDLVLAKTISLQYMNYAKLNNCPEKRLSLLRDFMSYVDDELGLTAPPAVPTGGQGATVSPLAQPQPTPQSNLIPNTAGAAA